MIDPTYTVRETSSNPPLEATGLTLLEAFTRIAALSGRDYAFTRTARVMHLVLMPAKAGERVFESQLAVDRLARADIMAQVCAHGLGQFQVTPDEPLKWKRMTHDHAA
jgi:hypothetical protein